MPLKLVPPRPGKTPYWAVRGTHLGLRVDRSTKTTVRATALKFLAKWKEEIERGLFARPGERTFLDAVVAYVADNGEDRFLPPITERLGSTFLRLIDQEMIDETAAALYPGTGPATRNRQLYTPISAVLKHARINWELRRPKGWRGERRTNWLKPEDAFKVFAAAERADPEFALFLKTLCYTGMRLGEAIGARLTDLDLLERYLLVRMTKNGSPRGVFLPTALTEWLAAHPRGLNRPGQKIFKFVKCGRLYTLLRSVETGSKIPDLTFHLFRHTWATWMRRYAGLDTTALLATETWKDAASVRRYEHVVASEESQKAERLPTAPKLTVVK